MQAAADQQVLALIAGVLRELIDLPQDGVIIAGQLVAESNRIRVIAEIAFGLGDHAFQLLDEAFDRCDRSIGGLDRADRLIHLIFDQVEVIRTLGQALGGEIAYGPIQSRVDSVTGGQALLGSVQQ